MIQQIVILLSSNLHASSELPGAEVPYGTLASQFANLAILLGLIFFTQRKKISQAFADKKTNFLKSVEESNQSKREAQAVLQEVSRRLEEIKTTFEKQVEKAKADSEESYRTQLADAKNEAMKIKSSAQANLEYEVLRQIELLRIDTFKKSAEKAGRDLEKKLTPEQLQSWTKHFVANAEGVH